jgi:putative sigma-54 modulation protein
MRVAITARHFELTPALRQLVEQRLAKLERILSERAISATITLTKEKFRHRTDLEVHTKGEHLLNGDGEGNSWTVSVREAVRKVEHQAEKLKSRWVEGKRQRVSAKGRDTAPTRARVEPAAPRRIVRPTRYAVKPMSIEDAAMRVESGPDTFVVFRNSETEAISIVHRRKDGSLGLIEPD